MSIPPQHFVVQMPHQINERIEPEVGDFGQVKVEVNLASCVA